MHKLALCIVICGAVAAVKGTEADPATSADIKYRATVVEYDPITPSGIREKIGFSEQRCFAYYMYDASSRHKPRMYMNGVAESNVPLINAPQMVMTSRQQAIKVMAQNVEHLVTAAKKGFESEPHLPHVVVFPEDGLYGSLFPTRDSILPFLEPIPDVNNGGNSVNPCNEIEKFNESSPILVLLSCKAKEHGIDLVADMGEVFYCNGSSRSSGKRNSITCPEDGRWQFNVAVAFHKDGQLKAKYRKSHLFFEFQFNEPPNGPDVVSWVSSFGVNFGMFICFDIMFPFPSQKLIDQGVHDFVYPTWWVNKPPMLTAPAAQSGFASGNSVNFIASGIGTSWSNSGSGVYGYYQSYPENSRNILCHAESDLQYVRGIQSSPTCARSDNAVSFYNPTQKGQIMTLSANLVTSTDTYSRPLSIHDPTFATPKMTSSSPAHVLKTFNKTICGINWNPSHCLNASVSFVNASEAKGDNLFVSSSVADLECKVDYVAQGFQNDSDTIFAFIAAHGMYNGLFTLRLCSWTPCAAMDTDCFMSGEYSSLFSTSSFSSINITGNFDAEWSVSGSGIGDYGFPLLDNRLQTRKLSPGNLYSLVYDGQEAETYFNTMLLYAKPKSPNQMKPSKV